MKTTLFNFALLLLLGVIIVSCSPKKESSTNASADSAIAPPNSDDVNSSLTQTTGFSKTFNYENYTFEVKTTGEGSLQKLSIVPTGLKAENKPILQEIEGSVTGAEVGDLNADGYPELLIYVTSAGSGSYGTVIGYSVNNGKSMSQIAFPSTADNPKINKGYMGHDEFAIVENNFAQRFKIYKEGDSNQQPTGKVRQIQYKLVDGEASRKFVVDKVVEY